MSTLDQEPAVDLWKRIRARSAVSLADSIRQMIQQQRLKAGDPLPPERELAPAVGLARNTVRSALRSLEREGLLQGDGTRGRCIAGPPALRPRTLAHTLAVVSDFPIAQDDARSRPGWPTFVFVNAQARVHQEGMQALTCALNQPHAIERLIASQPAGILLATDAGSSPHEHPLTRAARSADIPIVLHCDRSVAHLAGDCVCTDHAAGGRLLAQYLLSRGCRRILRAYRFPADPWWLQRRHVGFEQVLAEAGVEILPSLHTETFPLSGCFHSPGVFNACARLMVSHLLPWFKDEPCVDAVVGLTDEFALELIEALRLMGYEPGSIPVVGYDNSWPTTPRRAVCPWVPHATIEKHHDLIGRKMAEVLLQRLNAAPSPPVVHIVEPELVETPPAATRGLWTADPDN